LDCCEVTLFLTGNVAVVTVVVVVVGGGVTATV